MYDTLKRVYSATSKKGVASVLSQMRINKGKVTGTNGVITIGAYIPELDMLDVTVPAGKFIKAIEVADVDKLKTKLTTNGKLSIRAGKFRALIGITPNEAFPDIKASGNFVTCDKLLEALRATQPFIGTDAIRMWSNGVRLFDEYVYATNNVTIVRYKTNMQIPDITVPKMAVTELLRIGKEPTGIMCDSKSITFIMDDGVWLHSKLIDQQWPDVSRFFNDDCDYPELDIEILPAVEVVSEFCPNPKLPKLYFNRRGISTSEGDSSSTYEGIELSEGCYHADMLKDVLPSVETIDWSKYPDPCPFTGFGGKLTGIMMGLVQ